MYVHRAPEFEYGAERVGPQSADGVDALPLSFGKSSTLDQASQVKICLFVLATNHNIIALASSSDSSLLA